MFDNKIFDNSGGGGGGALTPGVTPVVGTDEQVLFVDGSVLGGAALLKYVKASNLLIRGYNNSNYLTTLYPAAKAIFSEGDIAETDNVTSLGEINNAIALVAFAKDSAARARNMGLYAVGASSPATVANLHASGGRFLARAASADDSGSFTTSLTGLSVSSSSYIPAGTSVDQKIGQQTGLSVDVSLSSLATLTYSTSSPVRALQSSISMLAIDASHASLGVVYGIDSSISFGYIGGGSAVQGNTALSSLYGARIYSQLAAGRGTITLSGNSYGLYVEAMHSANSTGGSGVVTIPNLYNLFVKASTFTGTGTNQISNVYGLYIEAQTIGQVSNYGIYIAGATQDNYIEGNLTVAGTLTANVAAAGSDTQIQFNDGGSFAGASGLLYDKTNIGLTLSRVADDALGPAFVFQQSRGAAGQVGDVLGAISFKGYNDNATPELIEYAQINSTICYPNDGGEGGSISFKFMQAGTLEEYVRFNVAGPSGYSTYFDFKTYSGSPVGPTLRIYAEGNNGGALVVDGRAGDGVIILSQELSEKWRIGHNITNAGLYLYSSVSGYTVLSVTHESATKQNIVFWGPTNTTIPATANKNLFVVNGGVAPTAVPVDMTSLWCADYAAGDARLSIMGEKNTNTLTLGAGNVLLRPDTMADDSVSGETFTGTAGENLVWGDVVYLKSDGKFWKADFNATTTTPAVAFCTGTISADASGEFLRRGWIRDDSAYNFTFGAQAGTIYLGESGAITQTAPSGSGDQVQVLGWALEADIWYFDPQFVIVEV